MSESTGVLCVSLIGWATLALLLLGFACRGEFDHLAQTFLVASLWSQVWRVKR